MRVLVTGADGFVGREVVAASMAAGHDVVAGTRGGARVGDAEILAYGDLCSTDWQKMHLAGCDAVVHLAARVHQMKDAAVDPLAAFRAK